MHIASHGKKEQKFSGPRQGRVVDTQVEFGSDPRDGWVVDRQVEFGSDPKDQLAYIAQSDDEFFRLMRKARKAHCR